MLYRVIGPAGSGKTEYLYQEIARLCAEGKSCVWISPEQQSVQAEKELLDRLGDGCNLSVEVLNFERLPERIARVYGGLNVRYPDKGAICALLSLLCEKHRKELTEYGQSARDEAFVTGLYGLFGKLRSECIRPEKLKQASENRLAAGERLGKKLHDVALLYEAYDAWFTDRTRDPRDALSVLASELPEKPFFAGKYVFVDGYYTFTGQEYALLTAVMKQAEAVYCTFSFDPSRDRELFEQNARSAFRLARAADRCEDVSVGVFRRSKKDELRYIENALWEVAPPPFAGETGAVRVIEAEDPFAESTAVASEILALVRNGMRWRDITVLARNPADYAGVLDTVLRENGIPFFFAEKEGILNHPLVAFAFASLEIIENDLSLSSLRKYLKTGYSGLPAEESDDLLRYAECWRLRGKDWKRGEDWVKNPDGYREGAPDEEQQAFLAVVNGAKDRLLADLEPLRNASKAKDRTVRTMLNALYAHLERVGAGDRFLDKVNALLENGEEERARIDSQVYGMLSGVMERIDDLCGDETMTVKGLLSLFKLTANAFSLGSIPTSSDSVSIGNPALFRGSSKAVIVIGCCDGVFPASAGKDPLFDEDEACALEEEEIGVVEPRLSVLNAERFYCYTALTSATETLLLTYPRASVGGTAMRRSPLLVHLQTLLPHLHTEQACRFSCYTAALDALHGLPDGEEKETLRKLLSEKGYDVFASSVPVTDPDAKIDFSGETLTLSASGLETYRKCPFSYFGSTLMRLKEKKENRFSTVEIGTFQHRVLELFLAEHSVSGKFVPPESKEALEKEADALADRCFAALTGGAKPDPRLAHTVKNAKKTLKRMLSDLVTEFSQGQFLPTGYEVSFGRPGDALPASEYTSADGRKIRLRGTIDRVDTYEKDGETFVRVVDYKSYGKGLDLSLAEKYGLDEQMLLYLFAYCKNAPATGKPLRPAGVLYDKVTLPFVEATGEETPDELLQMQSKKLERNGVILNDDAVIDAMDPTRSGRYAPISKTGKNLLSAERFAELETLVESQLVQSAEQIFAGDMDVRPLPSGTGTDACKYCKLRDACRREGEDDDD